MLLVICVLEVDFYSFQQCAMNVEFLKDGTNNIIFGPVCKTPILVPSK